MPTQRCWPWVLATSLCFMGCADAPPLVDSSDGSTGDAAQASESGASTVEVTIASADEIDAAIADARGSVVVLDCWSTSCPPCLAEFHHLVELHRAYADRGVVCISLSFDYEGGEATPEQSSQLTREFLESQGAVFTNFVSSTPAEALYRHLGFSAVPAVFVVDAEGERRKFAPSYGNDLVYDEVRDYVESLLADTSSR